MFKRGHVETAIVLVVLVLAIIGAYFVLRTSNFAGAAVSPVPYEQTLPPYLPYVSPMVACQNACSQQTTMDMNACLNACTQYSSVGDAYARRAPGPQGGPTGDFVVSSDRETNSITGNFAVTAAKEYGGAIRGVAAPGTRAFPSGRAYELPDQACYTCSCLAQGITAAERGSAEKVCFDNCGGEITNVVVGNCQ